MAAQLLEVNPERKREQVIKDVATIKEVFNLDYSGLIEFFISDPFYRFDSIRQVGGFKMATIHTSFGIKQLADL